MPSLSKQRAAQKAKSTSTCDQGTCNHGGHAKRSSDAMQKDASAKRQRAQEVLQEDDGSDSSSEALQLIIDEDGRVGIPGCEPPNYSFRSFSKLLPLGDENGKKVLETLIKDSAAAFTARETGFGERYSRGETFWVSADSTPKTLMETLALELFRLHTSQVVTATGAPGFDPTHSGAEWWTQVINSEDDIGWHWDRDYGLEADERIRLHPHVASVTYLSDTGAPTLILEAVEPPEGDGGGATKPLAISRAHVSHPQIGKHISFDGRWLHAAPSDTIDDAKSGKRVTFLVNIWLNHKPLSASVFQDASVLSPASGPSLKSFCLPFSKTAKEDTVKSLESDKKTESKSFQWNFKADGAGRENEEGEEEEPIEKDELVDADGAASASGASHRRVHVVFPISSLQKSASESSVSIQLGPGEGGVCPAD
eukprot:TRINITY_DN9666_c0_g1_i1.p1 TRINITY_DN9666_c0_g1~~TRINITY_DN9666_c0_g1_i1.p1  ORF type:complete len:424 (-),score=88.41 TRINITY_DN9666_c0_g1_i1:196-1467(-)